MSRVVFGKHGRRIRNIGPEFNSFFLVGNVPYNMGEVRVFAVLPVEED